MARTRRETVRLIAVELTIEEISPERRFERVIRSPTAYDRPPVSDETMEASAPISSEICSTIALLCASTSTLILRYLIAVPSSVSPTCSSALSAQVVPLSWSPTVSFFRSDEMATAKSPSTKLSLGARSSPKTSRLLSTPNEGSCSIASATILYMLS